ncbi:YcjF family protein [Christiangramia sabulilitoris]|uniref:DUF697 domain-containing protein n=1 Tax=Christiangramia sabulilitoris TaxID=2583991 RepID=A0A550I7L2_9FLAO|nr:GTPase [Christiangramia sabulilitoris]TRO66963.1 DUF697 domain-containing protein [Christiangramia sabulilitoris]
MITSASKEELAKTFQKEFNKVAKNVKKPNILIVGGTGVGKSTIVNSIFGEGTVKVGSGAPVTRGINPISTPEKSVNLFDTEGFEIGKDKEGKFQHEIVEYVKKSRSKPMEEQIHLIWHVVSASSTRVTGFDKQVHEQLQGIGIPVALIFSKCDEINSEDITSMLQEFKTVGSFESVFESPDSPFFTTNDKEFLEDEENFRLGKVVDWSIAKLPESLSFAFTSAQILNVEAKRAKANSIINQHTGGNALVGGSPIPFSDAPVLIASQATMIGRILFVYDMGNAKDMAYDFMKTTGASLVISNLGRSIAGNLLKLIPGVGTIIGGMINAGVASVITYAMGKATSELLYSLNKSILNGEESKASDLVENFGDIFSEMFLEFFNKKRK